MGVRNEFQLYGYLQKHTYVRLKTIYVLFISHTLIINHLTYASLHTFHSFREAKKYIIWFYGPLWFHSHLFSSSFLCWNAWTCPDGLTLIALSDSRPSLSFDFFPLALLHFPLSFLFFLSVLPLLHHLPSSSITSPPSTPFLRSLSLSVSITGCLPLWNWKFKVYLPTLQPIIKHPNASTPILYPRHPHHRWGWRHPLWAPSPSVILLQHYSLCLQLHPFSRQSRPSYWLHSWSMIYRYINSGVTTHMYTLYVIHRMFSST